MKKISFILLTMVLSIGFVMAQETNKTTGNAQFTSTTHDFGKIAEEVGSATCEFTLKNVGDTPIMIQDVRTSCGCTTPSYTTAPILPGKTGSIKVSYSTTGRVGAFTKKITVFTNEPATAYSLTIKGEVLPRK